MLNDRSDLFLKKIPFVQKGGRDEMQGRSNSTLKTLVDSRDNHISFSFEVHKYSWKSRNLKVLLVEKERLLYHILPQKGLILTSQKKLANTTIPPKKIWFAHTYIVYIQHSGRRLLPQTFSPLYTWHHTYLSIYILYVIYIMNVVFQNENSFRPVFPFVQ